MAKRKNKTYRCTATVVATSNHTNQHEEMHRSTKKLLHNMWVALVALVVAIAFSKKNEMKPIPEDDAFPTTQDGTSAHLQHQDLKKKQHQLSKYKIVDPSKFGGAWSLVQNFSETYDSQGLHYQLKYVFDISERAYDPSKRKVRAMAGHAGAGFDRTTRHKLLHDLEQFDFFLRTDLVGFHPHGRELFGRTIPSVYKNTLARLDQAAARGEFDEVHEYYRFTKADEDILSFYNRALFLPNLPTVQEPLLTPRDWAKVESQWLGEDISYPHPGIVVVDNLLSQQALQRVQNYLLLSTFWYEVKTPRFGRYIGAYINDGMNDPMMPEIAYELHKSMPRVMKDHHFKEMWSYKYESAPSDTKEATGIHIHADDAMVNVNLWITPDEANLDQNAGGLVIYTVKPSSDLNDNFESFNSNWEYVEKHVLGPSAYANVTIPYKQNRAVIFDSFLFHKSQPHKFKLGYENRRINLTFLYGDKQSGMKTGEEK